MNDAPVLEYHSGSILRLFSTSPIYHHVIESGDCRCCQDLPGCQKIDDRMTDHNGHWISVFPVDDAKYYRQRKK